MMTHPTDADMEAMARAISDFRTANDGWQRSDWLKADIRLRAVENYGALARTALSALPHYLRAVNCHADLVDGCNALLGLFQLLCARDDAPAWLKDAFETSHRVTEARAALAKALEP